MSEMTDAYLASPRSEPTRKAIPLGRVGQPSDLDGALLLLASSRASGFMTGAVHRGGWRAHVVFRLSRSMDFLLTAPVEALRRRVREFIAEEVMPLERERSNYDPYENIRLDVLEAVRGKAKALGLWAPQMPRERGGLGLAPTGMGGDLRGGEPFDLRPGRAQLCRTR